MPDEYVISGNAAILRCIVPVHCLDRIDSTDWLTDEDVSVFNYLGKIMDFLCTVWYGKRNKLYFESDDLTTRKIVLFSVEKNLNPGVYVHKLDKILYYSAN